MEANYKLIWNEWWNGVSNLLETLTCTVTPWNLVGLGGFQFYAIEAKKLDFDKFAFFVVDSEYIYKKGRQNVLILQ